MKYKYLCVGAGFAGAVIARELAENTNSKVLVIDLRDHIAGNSYSEPDPETNIMVHKYGPHIFHTNNLKVWQYVNRFSNFEPFKLQVKAKTHKGIYSLPINLLTINQFFNKEFTPKEAESFLKEIGDSAIIQPKNFEEQALKFVGQDLYGAFFNGYTKKQWGCDPKELSAAILQRLPIRFNYNDSYFNDRYCAIPTDGYTELIKNILAHPNIEVKLNTPYSNNMLDEFEHIFYSGTIDGYFCYCHGKLSYRTVYWENFHEIGDFQGNCIMNYCEEKYKHTRICEHKHFTPWLEYDNTVYSVEYSRDAVENELPHYPKRLASDLEILQKYQSDSQNIKKVTFTGRLGSYRYLDMHKVIEESLEVANNFLKTTK